MHHHHMYAIYRYNIHISCDTSSKKHIKTITKKINGIFDQYATKQYQSNQSKQSKQSKQTVQADSIDDPADDIDT